MTPITLRDREGFETALAAVPEATPLAADAAARCHALETP